MDFAKQPKYPGERPVHRPFALPKGMAVFLPTWRHPSTQRFVVSLKAAEKVLGASPAILFLWRVAPGVWPIEFVSRNVADHLGYAAEELMSGAVSWVGITHPDDLARLEGEVREHLERGDREWSQEYRVVARSGEVRRLLDWNTALRDERGWVTHVQAVVLDISAQWTIEEDLRHAEEKFRSLAETLATGIAVIGPDMRVRALNSRMRRWFPKADAAVRPFCYEVFNVPPRPGVCSYCPTVRAFRDGEVHESVTATPDGSSVRNYRVIASPVKDGSGKVTAVVEMVEDVTDHVRLDAEMERSRRELEETVRTAAGELEVSERRLREVTDRAGVWVWEVDRDGVITYSNGTVERVLGIPAKEVVGRASTGVLCGAGDGLAALLRRPEPFRDVVQKLKGPGGADVWFSASGAPLLDADGGLAGFRGVHMDVTRLKKAEEEMRAASLSDELTGLANRRAFFTLSEQYVKIARRMKKRGCILFIDIDGMKRVNDGSGHGTGDRVLAELSGLLREVFRESDIVARLGGDEFAILALDIDGVSGEVLLDRLRSRLEAFNADRPVDLRISVSCGIRNFDPGEQASIEELLTDADRLMYEEKKRKKAAARPPRP